MKKLIWESSRPSLTCKSSRTNSASGSNSVIPISSRSSRKSLASPDSDSDDDDQKLSLSVSKLPPISRNSVTLRKPDYSAGTANAIIPNDIAIDKKGKKDQKNINSNQEKHFVTDKSRQASIEFISLVAPKVVVSEAIQSPLVDTTQHIPHLEVKDSNATKLSRKKAKIDKVANPNTWGARAKISVLSALALKSSTKLTTIESLPNPNEPVEPSNVEITVAVETVENDSAKPKKNLKKKGKGQSNSDLLNMKKKKKKIIKVSSEASSSSSASSYTSTSDDETTSSENSEEASEVETTENPTTADSNYSNQSQILDDIPPSLSNSTDISKSDDIDGQELINNGSDEIVSKINPLTRLKFSQYNLFSNTAGAFRGPGDVYYKFVLGGKSIRAGAQKHRKIKLRELDSGKLDDFLIERAKKAAKSLWDYKSITNLRKIHREYLINSISEKINSLEQSRAYIITTIEALNAFRHLEGELKEQNDLIKVKYKQVMATTNSKVSETLSHNEDFVERILKLEREKENERKRVVKEFGNYLRQCELHKREMQNLMEQKQKAFEAKIQDMEDLKEFKKASFEDPASTEKRVAHELDLMAPRLMQLEMERAQMGTKFAQQELECERMVSDRGLEIFEQSIAKFKNYVEGVTQKLKIQNAKFKDEIKLQEHLSNNLKHEIHGFKLQKKALQVEIERATDPRRNVFRLKDFMTCTGDMDIILPENVLSNTLL